MMLGFEREQESLNARTEFHHTRRLADVVIGGFKSIH
jgi:hypothetical protein